MASIIYLVWMVGLWGWWPLVAAFGVGFVIVLLTKTEGDVTKIADVKAAKARLRQHAEEQIQRTMHDVHAWMAFDGVSFERAVARIYRDQGFDVDFTPRTNDQGVDLILKRNGSVSIVQCKAYATNVGVNAVRELVGVRASWPNAEQAILVTLFGCSRAAKDFAAKHGVALYSITRDFLKTDYRPAGATEDR